MLKEDGEFSISRVTARFVLLHGYQTSNLNPLKEKQELFAVMPSLLLLPLILNNRFLKFCMYSWLPRILFFKRFWLFVCFSYCVVKWKILLNDVKQVPISHCVLHLYMCPAYFYICPAYLYMCPAYLYMYPASLYVTCISLLVSCISTCLLYLYIALHLHLCLAPLHASVHVCCICICALHLHMCPASLRVSCTLHMSCLSLYVPCRSIHVLCVSSCVVWENGRPCYAVVLSPAADWIRCLLWAWRCSLYYHHQTTPVCEIRLFNYEKSMEFWLLFKILLTQD